MGLVGIVVVVWCKCPTKSIKARKRIGTEISLIAIAENFFQFRCFRWQLGEETLKLIYRGLEEFFIRDGSQIADVSIFIYKKRSRIFSGVAGQLNDAGEQVVVFRCHLSEVLGNTGLAKLSVNFRERRAIQLYVPAILERLHLCAGSVCVFNAFPNPVELQKCVIKGLFQKYFGFVCISVNSLFVAFNLTVQNPDGDTCCDGSDPPAERTYPASGTLSPRLTRINDRRSGACRVEKSAADRESRQPTCDGNRNNPVSFHTIRINTARLQMGVRA